MAWGRGKSFRSFFTFNRGEQKGIIILLSLIVMVIALNFLYPYFYSKNIDIPAQHKKELETFLKNQHRLADSIDVVKLQNTGRIDKVLAKNKIHPFKFNPNKLPSEEWLKMGFTKEQVKTIKKYEARGGLFYTKYDVKKMYSISDNEYDIIEPFIVIPEKITPKRKQKKKKITSNNFINTNINTADKETLIKNLKLKPKIATRTISFRKSLGGFYSPEQIKEVYGMSDFWFLKIRDYIIVDSSQIVKIKINTVTFKELLSHPYFNYQTTKAIFNARDKIGSFKTIEQISNINAVNDSIIVKILPYIEINTQTNNE